MANPVAKLRHWAASTFIIAAFPDGQVIAAPNNPRPGSVSSSGSTRYHMGGGGTMTPFGPAGISPATVSLGCGPTAPGAP